MSIFLDSIELHEDLWWEDEIWTPVNQKSTISSACTLLLDIDVVLAGRPITLVGTETTAWISRETVEALMAASAIPGKEMTLTLRGRTFVVIFSHEGGNPVDVDPIVRMVPVEAGDFYWVKKISFIVKEETTGP